ncbi:MAG: adenylate/guanylate cyclase domain-containing protein, partial [Leptonema sp. (in: Bacteria)]|nr:adenylate/guanylate cyclase domain-containing protein [Leptonema sp. (in: bacteria)]
GEETLLGIFYGTMIVMLIYNIFILLSVKDISYFYYVGYILFWSFFLLTFNGLGFQYLWPNSVWWANNCLNIFAFTTLAFMQLFAMSFLDTKNHTPYLHRFLIGMLVLSISGVIASTLMPYRIGIKLVSLHAILTVITILTTGVRTQIKGYKPARFFLLAWTVMLVGLLVLTLRNFGVLPDNLLTRWSSQFGSALEVVVLAFALADRINTLKAERIRLEREAYETKLRLLHAFTRFVPNEFLEILGKASVEDISHGDSIEKPMAVLFTDIRNFTSISEKMDSADNFKFLNSYLKQMGPIIIKHHGFIDKFIGDAIMALFPRDPSDAIRCAIEMRQRLINFNEHRKTKGYQDYSEIEMGIGIHYGNVMLGTVGSEVRLETTVIGDTVNLASRLENLTKTYRANILISGDLYDAIKDKLSEIRIREIDRVYVKGRTHMSRIYEVYEADSEAMIKAKEEHAVVFQKAYQHFLEGEFGDAEKEFQKYQLLSPLDSVGNLHLMRCKRLIDKNPETWKGAIRLRH